MRMPRTSIAGLMGAVLVTSLGLTALRSGSAVWAGATFLAMCGVMALAVVGAVCRQGQARAWWLGFALFGWGYLVLAFVRWRYAPRWNLPTNLLLTAFGPRLGPPAQPVGMGGVDWWGMFAYSQAGHSLMALAAALLGGLLSFSLFGQPAGRSAGVVAETPREGRPRRRWWRRPAVVGPAGLVVASGVALFGLNRAPGVTAAAAFFATWGLLGLAVVGAAFGTRERRASWLGAALFGIGYMNLMFHYYQPRSDQPDWPHAVADRLLYALRGYFPEIVREVPDTSDVAGWNARILKALNQPLPMRYPDAVTLEEMIKAIQVATRGPDDRGIPIYVDPFGLQEVEQTMQSLIRLDYEGVPLRKSLRLALGQLQLTYEVSDGLLTIMSEYNDTDGPPPAHEDPFLVVGHCLLGLAAAGLGGLLAPRVCK